MMCDSTNSAAAGEKRSFPPFPQLSAKIGHLIFGSFPPFFRAIRQSSPLPVLALLTACATTPPPVIKTVIRDVPVPYYQPCPAEKDIPAPPKTVHEEHPVMPEAKDKAAIDQLLGAASARERILAGKILEYRTYAETADAVLHACAAPPVPAPAH